MNWKKWQTIVALLGGLIFFGGSVYGFWNCKASKESVTQLAGDYHNYQDVQRKRAIEQRIWDIKRAKPNTWQNDHEYQRLQTELNLLNIKIKAYYQKGGK